MFQVSLGYDSTDIDTDNDAVCVHARLFDGNDGYRHYALAFTSHGFFLGAALDSLGASVYTRLIGIVFIGADNGKYIHSARWE